MTNIEWTHLPGFARRSWDPVVGCDIVSPGCTRCYAMKMAHRIQAMQPGTTTYGGTTKLVKGKPVWTGKIARAREEHITAPLRARKPACWFVNSMGDLFHENVPDAWIDDVFAIMALSPQHRFIILTKRADRLRAYMTGERRRLEISMAMLNLKERERLSGKGPWPLPNLALGVSAEDQRRADERIPDLLATPATVRILSAEPLLGPIDLLPHLFIYTHADDLRLSGDEALPDLEFHDPQTTPIEDVSTPRLDWVIAGGESGPDARDNDFLTNARALRDQCASADVPFFGKQNVAKRLLPVDLAIHQWPEAWA